MNLLNKVIPKKNMDKLSQKEQRKLTSLKKITENYSKRTDNFLKNFIMLMSKLRDFIIIWMTVKMEPKWKFRVHQAPKTAVLHNLVFKDQHQIVPFYHNISVRQCKQLKICNEQLNSYQAKSNK